MGGWTGWGSRSGHLSSQLCGSIVTATHCTCGVDQPCSLCRTAKTPSERADTRKTKPASLSERNCREKEMQRALQLQEKQTMRLRQREAAVTGPKDDLVSARAAFAFIGLSHSEAACSDWLLQLCM